MSLEESKNDLLKKQGKDRLKFKINFSPAVSEEKPPVIQKGTIEKEQKSFETQYTLGEVLGEGAHAVVKVGWSKKANNQKVAVKVFRSGDPEIVNTIKRTYNNTRFLNHPSLLRELELFINEKTETSFLVMEFCQYPSLESILRKNLTLDESSIRLLAQDLLTTIEYVHLKGVCHRDIKPDNILINESALLSTKSPSIKLIDFGVSKRFYQIVPGKVGSFTLDMWTQTGNVHYCAPEIFKGGGYDASVDIWSIGVVLYQAFTGKLPFNEGSLMETIKLITDKSNNRHFQLEEFKKASLNCQDFIKRLLKADPKERISCQGKKLQALKHPFLFSQQDKRSKDDEQVSGSINSIKREQLIKSYQFSNLLPNNGLKHQLQIDKNEDQKLQEKLNHFKQNTTLDQIQIVKRNNQTLTTIDLISSFNSYSQQKVVSLQQESIKENDELIETSTYEIDNNHNEQNDQQMADLDELGCINAEEDVEQ